MKLSFSILLICLCGLVKAQDSINIENNYKYRVGIKGISEKCYNNDYFNEALQLYGGGFQIIRKIGKSISSIESGLYINTKTADYTFYQKSWEYYPDLYFIAIPVSIRYENVSLPINYRIDTKIVYFTGGITMDYMIGKTVNRPEYLDSISYKKDKIFTGSLNFTLGMEKEINKLFSLFVEARTAYTIFSTEKEDSRQPSQAYLNYGFGIGVNYKLATANN